MAGAERLTDAHGNRAGSDQIYSDTGMIEGLCTNYSLMMLSQCIRDVAKSKKPEEHSFRAYKVSRSITH